MNIVSFLPSATEIACALGLSDSLLGITHECDYPPEVRTKPVVVRNVLPIITPDDLAKVPLHVDGSGKGVKIGDIGKVKLSDRILMRVVPQGPRNLVLLREASSRATARPRTSSACGHIIRRGTTAWRGERAPAATSGSSGV